MFIEARLKNEIEYFYLRENKSVNGKSICVFQKYIGNKDKLIKAIQNGLKLSKNKTIIKPDETTCIHFGSVAVLYEICKKLNLFEIIDSVVNKKKQNMPVSIYLIAAAINRAIEVKSKRAISKWLEKTSLPSLIKKLQLKKLTSQNYWNNMDLITKNHITTMEDKITHNVIQKYNLNLDTLLYDSTNYYSFIHSFNQRCHIENRGKNKQHRNDLRQVNVALMVTKDFHIPLYHKLYEGNKNDYTNFKETILDLKEKRNKLTDDKNIILIFDSGNVSKDSMDLIDKYEFKFISKLKPTDHTDLLKIDLDKYNTYYKQDNNKKSQIKFYRTEKILYGSKKLVVIKFNPDHYNAECKTICNHIKEARSKLINLETRLDEYIKNKRLPTNVKESTVKNNIKSIFKGRTYLNKIIKIEVKLKDKKYPSLDWKISDESIEQYCKTYLGKTIYFSNVMTITAKELVKTYSFQSRIENIFKISKDRKGGCWWPKYHWTDQKIMVHAFYCFLSLLLLSLLEKELFLLNIKDESHNIMEELHEIYEVIDIYKNKGGKIHTLKRVSKLNNKQAKIFKHFNLETYFNNS